MEVQYTEFNKLMAKIGTITYYSIYEDDILMPMMKSKPAISYLNTGVVPILNEYEINIFTRARDKERDKEFYTIESLIDEINYNLSIISNDGQRTGYLNFLLLKLERILSRLKKSWDYEAIISSDVFEVNDNKIKIHRVNKLQAEDHIGRYCSCIIFKVNRLHNLIFYIKNILDSNQHTPLIKNNRANQTEETIRPKIKKLKEVIEFSSLFDNQFKPHEVKFIQILKDLEIINDGEQWNPEKEKGIAKVFWQEMLNVNIFINTISRNKAGEAFQDKFGANLAEMFKKDVGVYANNYRPAIIKSINKVLQEIQA